MNRTIQELATHGNPFQETEQLTRMLMPRRSQEHMRRWTAEDPPGLGALNKGTLATFGLVMAHRMSRAGITMTTGLEDWLFLGDDSGPGQVSQIAVARTLYPTQQGSKTTALLLSPPLGDHMSRRAGIRLQIDRDSNSMQGASVEIVDVRSDSRGMGMGPEEFLDKTTLGPVALRALDEHRLRDLRYPSTAHALVPLVVDCNRLFAELAASTNSADWARQPLMRV